MNKLVTRLLFLRDQQRRRFRERRVAWDKFTDPDDLCDEHFRARCDPHHINYGSLKLALNQLNGDLAVIIETGTSAHGTDSTLLFDGYVRSFGGKCMTVDIDPSTVTRARKRVSNKTSVSVGDSVEFLTELSDEVLGAASLLYLDSFDVDFSAPRPAADHCLAEFAAVESRITPGTLVLIDDSPASTDWFSDFPADEYQRIQRDFASSGLVPGKGMLLVPYLVKNGATLLYHDYQALFRL
jgi:hypothetical protein